MVKGDLFARIPGEVTDYNLAWLPSFWLIFEDDKLEKGYESDPDFHEVVNQFYTNSELLFIPDNYSGDVKNEEAHELHKVSGSSEKLDELCTNVIKKHKN